MAKTLALIFLLSAFCRFAFWPITPPELFGDELDVGYQAYSLFHTGKDLAANPLPFYLQSLAEYRLPGLIYATVPSIWLFDLTKFSVRFPQMLFGALTPLVFFTVTYLITQNKNYSFFAALSLALTPWHVHYSRSAFEAALLLLLILIGTYGWLTSRHLLALVCFAASMYTYSTAILFTPLWVLVLFLKYRPPVASPKFLLSAVTFTVLLLPLTSSVISGPALNRYHLLSIFSDPQHVDQILDNRAMDTGALARFFYNRPESISRAIVANYLRSFSTDFLFIRGDPALRHGWQYVGVFLPVFAPLLVIGAYFAIRKHLAIIIAWLLLAPLPSAITSDGAFHATRLFLLVAPACALIGIGAAESVSKLKTSILGKTTLAIFALLFAVQLTLVSNYFLNIYPKRSWLWWHTGYESIFKQLVKVSGAYNRIVINNTYEPSLIRYLFYTKYPPRHFHKSFTSEKPVTGILPFFDGFTIDNRVFFGSFSPGTEKMEFASRLLPNTLYLVSQRDDVGGDWDWRQNPPDKVNVIAVSTNPFDRPVLYLVSQSPQ